MKRYYLLTATIISVVICSILTIDMISTLLVLGNWYFNWELWVSVNVILILVGITTLALNACSIALYKKTKAEFKNKLALVGSALIFNYITSALLIADIVLLFIDNLGVGAVYILYLLSLIVSIVFMHVDLAAEEKRIEKPKQTVPQNRTNSTTPVAQNVQKASTQSNAVQQISTVNQSDGSIQSEDEFEKKLIKLNDMLGKGLITQDEYDTIKKSYIEKYIK